MKIGVIGTGVIGLSSAVALRRRGFTDVTVYFRDDLPATTSSRAGAVFTPFDAGSHAEWIAGSLRAFREMARTQPHSGVCIGTAHEYLPGDAPIPAWTGIVGGVHVWEHAATPPSPTAHGFDIDVPMMDMRVYLAWLKTLALELGVRFVQRDIGSFDEVFASGTDAIVNCAGLGARELCLDRAMRPMRGQLLHVPNALGLTDAIAAPEADGDVTYVYPFPDYIVLGGTYELDESRCETDDASLARILLRSRRLLSAHTNRNADALGETILRRVAGLRPTRVINGCHECVRLELERSPAGPIIHNYGHGRAGVTLSWGCANAVAKLLHAETDANAALREPRVSAGHTLSDAYGTTSLGAITPRPGPRVQG